MKVGYVCMQNDFLSQKTLIQIKAFALYCRCAIKKVKRFFRKSRFSWSKKEIMFSESIHTWAFDRKILTGWNNVGWTN